MMEGSFFYTQYPMGWNKDLDQQYHSEAFLMLLILNHPGWSLK